MQDALHASSVVLSHLPEALAHSLWQAAMVALIVYAALRRIPAGRANLRYGIAVAGLILIVTAVLATWAMVGGSESGTADMPLAADDMGVVASPDPAAIHSDSATPPVPTPPVVVERHTETALAPIVLTCWAVGVAAMMLRLLWLVLGVGALRRHSRPMDDPSVQALLTELKTLVGVSRRVALRVADDVVSPVAMGLIWPAIVLPTSIALGVPQEQLRAILAHELAHIRRLDYLVNFGQLIVEALLYFNPAVWWISRQIRVEREACCDAVAARALGDTLHYADALTCVTRYVHEGYAMAAMQAFGAHTGSETMADRLRRLLLPDHRPRLRLRWYSVLAGTLLSFAALFGLYQSAALAKRFLTDTERIAAMADLAETYQPPLAEESSDRIPISVAVVTYDGAPLPDEKGFVETTVINPRSTSGHGMGRDRGSNRFCCRVGTGDAYVTAVFPGYAPTMLEPFRIDAQDSDIELQLTLEQSFPATVRFVTPDGIAIPYVALSGGYKFCKNSWSGNIRVTSDASGEARVEQREDPLPVMLRAKAEGFQEAEQRDLMLVPGEVLEWVLQPDEPIEGLVVDRSTGTPLGGAEVALVFDTSNAFAAGPEGKTITTADGMGRFALRGLADGRRYFFLVRAPGYGPELAVVTAGQNSDVRVQLAPRYVRGILRGDLNLLARAKNGVTPVIAYGMDMSIPGEGHSHGDSGHEIPVTIVDGEGHFLIEDLRAGELFIQAGPTSVNIPVTEPIENLVIDVATPESRGERTVIVNLPVPEGAPAAEGRLIVQPQDGTGYSERRVPVRAGRAETTVIPPARISLRTVGLNGYIPVPIHGPWEPDDLRSGWRIPPGDDPFVIELPLERAGAIEGQVVLPDGTPAQGAYVYVRMDSPENGLWPDDYFCYTNTNLTCDADGRFAALPIPFNETFLVQANVDFARAEVRVTVHGDEPIASVQMQIPEGVDVPILVVDPSGTPMPDMEVLGLSPGGGHGGLRTGADGIFMLRGADPNTAYFVEAHPTRDYCFTRIRVPFDGSRAVLRLEKGVRVAGVVQRSDTGDRVANVGVTAHAMYETATQVFGEYEVKTVTDAEGRFEFTNLREGQLFSIEANARQWGLFMLNRQFVKCTAGQGEPVVVQLQPGE